MFADLPGSFTIALSDSHADFFIRNQVAVVVEHDLGRYGRRAVCVPLTRWIVADLGAGLPCYLEAALDHIFRPWRYPDRPAFPVVVLFPRLDRLRTRVELWRRRLVRRPKEFPGDVAQRSTVWRVDA